MPQGRYRSGDLQDRVGEILADDAQDVRAKDLRTRQIERMSVQQFGRMQSIAVEAAAMLRAHGRQPDSKVDLLLSERTKTILNLGLGFRGWTKEVTVRETQALRVWQISESKEYPEGHYQTAKVPLPIETCIDSQGVLYKVVRGLATPVACPDTAARPPFSNLLMVQGLIDFYDKPEQVVGLVDMFEEQTAQMVAHQLEQPPQPLTDLL